jgi:ubiquinol-cytochrome c reductase cytochrome c1 subunit
MLVYADQQPIRLESARINTRDVKSVEKGAQSFAIYCMVCHSLDYLTHDPIAKAAGITLNRMPSKNRSWPFGVTPPDLSLIARIHSPDWLYTYLHAFYDDPSSPTRSNNLLVDNVKMPDPFLGIQGEQVLIVNKKQLFANYPPFTRKLPYFAALDLTRAGTMQPDEFDRMVRDLVNFLVYASEPKRYAREKLGIWVLAFLALLFIIVYLLKREYWKKVKKNTRT